MRGSNGPTWVRLHSAIAAVAVSAVLGVVSAASPASGQQSQLQQVLRGRQLVIEQACSGCHGGAVAPDAAGGWLLGVTDSTPQLEFLIGPCAIQPGAQPCFRTRPRNLTPDNLTGIGRFSERQIFNALRFGLRPGETQDVEITSSTPGQGNFPMNPKFLAPPMPWPAFRHLPDEDLWAIAAYLKNGVKPVRNIVEDSEGPPDFWASAYTPEALGPLPAAAFPTATEVVPSGPNSNLDKVRRGRAIVIRHDCGGCHIGGTNPAAEGWLAGVVDDQSGAFPIGPCAFTAGATPCFWQRPRNLTPDEATGTGKYTERQIFNALRYGLRPSTTPDVEITSSTPGKGNFPSKPDYLGLGMPWTSWRYMSDDDLWAVAAYLKNGLKPVSRKVQDSDSPPDLWASEYTVEKIGAFPAPPFPTAREVRPSGSGDL